MHPIPSNSREWLTMIGNSWYYHEWLLHTDQNHSQEEYSMLSYTFDDESYFGYSLLSANTRHCNYSHLFLWPSLWTRRLPYWSLGSLSTVQCDRNTPSLKRKMIRFLMLHQVISTQNARVINIYIQEITWTDKPQVIWKWVFPLCFLVPFPSSTYS